jgi:hypothetical protein
MSDYYTTQIELARDGVTRLRYYHRNGNARGDNVTRVWTHPVDDPTMQTETGPVPCPACVPKESR